MENILKPLPISLQSGILTENVLHTQETVTTGESGASVFRFTLETGESCYLKYIAPLEDELNLYHICDENLVLSTLRPELGTKLGAGRISLDERTSLWKQLLRAELKTEVEILHWLTDRLLVPKVLDFYDGPEGTYLLLAAIEGKNAADLANDQENIPILIPLLAQGLLQLHSIPIGACPFDETTTHKLNKAKQHVEYDMVTPDDFDAERIGRTVNDLFDELLSTVPKQDELVFTHGDYCLPNIMLDFTSSPKKVTGFIDLGRAGVADRYFDLALARRSIIRNCGSEWVQPFFDAYGLPTPDESKLHFFQLLDEFF
ncbi:aminoglycoside 3'-phosphotransferase [Chloroflexi bacterium TSY]|nr:aminoglycoside 3'-phosphotransferase [Chloroflexi bacterium TSY]